VNATDLEREFAVRAVPYSGGLLLLRPDDALALVRRSAQVGVPILGVDGMFLRGLGVELPINHIADFSAAVERGDGCWGPAVAFIEERRKLGMVFEVVLGASNLPAGNEAFKVTRPEGIAG